MILQDISELKEQIKNHELRISKLEEVLKSNHTPLKRKTSMREFILEKKPQNERDLTLAMGYYLEKFEDRSCFTTKELEKEFERAREKTPKNVPNQIAMNRNKGYIMKADEEKDKKTAYCLTNKGITFVENNFSEDG